MKIRSRIMDRFYLDEMIVNAYRQLEKIGNADLVGEELQEEISRASCIARLGGMIVDAMYLQTKEITEFGHNLPLEEKSCAGNCNCKSKSKTL